MQLPLQHLDKLVPRRRFNGFNEFGGKSEENWRRVLSMPIEALSELIVPALAAKAQAWDFTCLARNDPTFVQVAENDQLSRPRIAAATPGR